MEELRFTAVHEDGRHLVLASPGSGEEYLVPVDERLRAALRSGSLGARPAPAAQQASPRSVQALVRAGETAEGVAEATGWTVERVRRFEAPIVAEREHVARLAQACHVRARGADGPQPTLASRVHERLTARGVEPGQARWDAVRREGTGWTVVVAFTAGGRERRAAWRYLPADRRVEALDDEARWLSEDEQSLPGGAAAKSLLGEAPGAVDLMTTMRERSRARGRRRRGGDAAAAAAGSVAAEARPDDGADVAAEVAANVAADPAAVPGSAQAPEDLLPLEDLPYDPATMGPPPSAHGHPADDAGVRPEGTAEAADGEEPAVADDEVADRDADLADDDGQETDADREATLADFFGDEGDEDGEDYALDQGTGAPHDASEPEDHDDSGDGPGEAEPEDEREPAAGPQERPAARRKSRPSVPSWDDIMFGAKNRR